MFDEIPYNKHLKQVARDLRKNATLSEVLLWNKLKRKQFLGLDFTREKVIGNCYIADFFCPKKRIAIEIDGSSHIGKEKQDENRDYALLNELGIKVIRVTANDVEKNMNKVLKILQEFFSTQ